MTRSFGLLSMPMRAMCFRRVGTGSGSRFSVPRMHTNKYKSRTTLISFGLCLYLWLSVFALNVAVLNAAEHHGQVSFAGVPVPGTVQFPSLVPLITGAKKQLHEALYAAFLDRQRAVRTERWKLIRTPSAGAVQLFDVRHDPWERHNLALDPKHAATVAMLDARLHELMREMRDPLPEKQLFASAARGQRNKL